MARESQGDPYLQRDMMKMMTCMISSLLLLTGIENRVEQNQGEGINDPYQVRAMFSLSTTITVSPNVSENSAVLNLWFYDQLKIQVFSWNYQLARFFANSVLVKVLNNLFFSRFNLINNAKPHMRKNNLDNFSPVILYKPIPTENISMWSHCHHTNNLIGTIWIN